MERTSKSDIRSSKWTVRKSFSKLSSDEEEQSTNLVIDDAAKFCLDTRVSVQRTRKPMIGVACFGIVGLEILLSSATNVLY